MVAPPRKAHPQALVALAVVAQVLAARARQEQQIVAGVAALAETTAGLRRAELGALELSFSAIPQHQFLQPTSQ